MDTAEDFFRVECEQTVYDVRGDEPEFLRNQYCVILVPRIPASGEFFRWHPHEDAGAELVVEVMVYSYSVSKVEGGKNAALILADVYCGTDEELEAENWKLEKGWWVEDVTD